MTLTLILASTGAIAFMITFLVEVTRDARQYDEQKIVEFVSRKNRPETTRPLVRSFENQHERDAEQVACAPREASCRSVRPGFDTVVDTFRHQQSQHYRSSSGFKHLDQITRADDLAFTLR